MLPTSTITQHSELLYIYRYYGPFSIIFDSVFSTLMSWDVTLVSGDLDLYSVSDSLFYLYLRL